MAPEVRIQHMNFENTSIQSTPYFLMYSVLSTCIFSIKALHSLLGFPCGSAGKESACNVGDLGSIPGLGRSPGEGKGYPLQCSGLENTWTVHEVVKSQTRLSAFQGKGKTHHKTLILRRQGTGPNDLSGSLQGVRATTAYKRQDALDIKS